MLLKSYEEQLMYIDEFKAKKYIQLYFPPILLFLGTFGNVFSFIILRQRSMTRQSTYFYLATLSVADCLVLYVGLLRKWIGELTGYDLRVSSDWLCKFTVLLGYLFSDFSVWLIIAVTIERYIVVCWPLKANSVCIINRAKILIVALFFVLLAVNLHFMWTVKLDYIPIEDGAVQQPICSGVFPHTELVGDVWPWVDACIYSFLPLVILSALNVLIVRQVSRARRERCQLFTNDNNRKHLRKAYSESSRKLTILLLTVSFTFLVTTLPMNITLIISAFIRKDTFDTVNTVRFSLGQTITEMLMYVNHSINFFLYCAAGQKFRKQIFLLLCSPSRQVYRPSMSENSPSSMRRHKNTFPLNQQTLIIDSEEGIPRVEL